MLILVESGLSARKFGRNDRSPAVSGGFRSDFEGSACDPAPKREYKRKAAVRGGFAPGPGRAIGSGGRSGFGGDDVMYECVSSVGMCGDVGVCERGHV